MEEGGGSWCWKMVFCRLLKLGVINGKMKATYEKFMSVRVSKERKRNVAEESE